MYKSPVTILAMMCHRTYGKDILTKVTNIQGPDHRPLVTVEIKTPDGITYTSNGRNQRVAKQRAAEMALLNFKN